MVIPRPSRGWSWYRQEQHGMAAHVAPMPRPFTTERKETLFSMPPLVGGRTAYLHRPVICVQKRTRNRKDLMRERNRSPPIFLSASGRRRSWRDFEILVELELRPWSLPA